MEGERFVVLCLLHRLMFSPCFQHLSDALVGLAYFGGTSTHISHMLKTLRDVVLLLISSTDRSLEKQCLFV